MPARLVRFTLALELAAYVALGAWLSSVAGRTLPAVVALAIALALGARFLLVCFSSFVGWVYCSPCAPEHRIGLAGVPRLVLGEYRALLCGNLWYLPWDSVAMRPEPVPTPVAQPPVILVHGYMSNRGFFGPLQRWLDAQGVAPVFAPNFHVLFDSIEQFAAELHDEIERIAQGSGQPRVILVCHSMGGLAARRYLQDHGAGRIARLVTIASPHHGTAVAKMGLGLNARQMTPGSDFLRELERAEAASPPAVETLSIWSPHDNLVSPQDTSRLPWAREHVIPGVAHVGLLSSPRTFAALRPELPA
jgi:triacylglycerol esterase/lipase EstA (alpha/beta hydrolase family)